jgi:glycosyltransferase involved in cell wall biosynthesis
MADPSSRARISVAMGTYNGEHFIREQLESLAQQTLLPYELVVRDDASTDRTLRRVEEFARDAPFPVRIYKNNTRLGYPDNFIKAAGLTRGEWIAFCDQDDVWLPKKLEQVGAGIAECGGLVLVVHSAELVNEHLERTGGRYPNIRRRRIVGTLAHSQTPLYPGFCCTFARALLDEVRWDVEEPRAQHTHDSWICFLANAIGYTYYIPEPLVLYRRHNNTVTGGYDRRLLLSTINHARNASSDDYQRHSQINLGYAYLLQSRSKETKSWAISAELRRACAHYIRFSRRLDSRALLYRGRRFRSRIEVFLSLLMEGAYIGRSPLKGRIGQPSGIVLGRRALAKDVVVTLLGSSFIAKH